MVNLNIVQANPLWIRLIVMMKAIKRAIGNLFAFMIFVFKVTNIPFDHGINWAQFLIGKPNYFLKFRFGNIGLPKNQIKCDRGETG